MNSYEMNVTTMRQLLFYYKNDDTYKENPLRYWSGRSYLTSHWPNDVYRAQILSATHPDDITEMMVANLGNYIPDGF